MAYFSFGASAKPKTNPVAPFAGAVAGAPITGFDIGKAFIEQGNQQNAQKAVQAGEQRKFQSGVIHGRHLGTGGGEGSNSADPWGNNPFTPGSPGGFLPPGQRQGLQSLTPEAVGAREQAGFGLPNTGRPSVAGGVVTDSDIQGQPAAMPTLNYDHAAMLAEMLGIPTPPPGVHGAVTSYGPAVGQPFRAPANF